MSTNIWLITGAEITARELSTFVVNLGGEVYPESGYDGFFRRDDGTIWVSVDAYSLTELMEEEGGLATSKLGAVPQSMVDVRIRSHGNSRLALEFCAAFAEHWPSVVSFGHGNYWSRDDLRRAKAEGRDFKGLL